MAPPQLFPNQPKPEEHVQKHQTKESASVAVNNQLNSVATRLKVLEERYTTMRKKSQVTEQNIIETEKEQFQQFRLLGDEIMELKHTIKEIAEKVTMLADEVNQFASKRDVQVLEKYTNYWQPMDYVTRKEVNAFLRRKFKGQH